MEMELFAQYFDGLEENNVSLIACWRSAPPNNVSGDIMSLSLEPRLSSLHWNPDTHIWQMQILI